MATAHAPGFPLPLRNGLAHLVIAGLDDATARDALVWLAANEDDPAPDASRARLATLHLVEPDGTLLDVHRPHVERVRVHARRGLDAAQTYVAPSRPTQDRIAAAVARAVALWNEQLFFEVHEVLETEWQRTTGPERHALQGVIQIGVALHHHLHGNPRGARTLMREGRERLAAARDALPTLDVAGLLATTAPWEAALIAGTASQDTEPPRLASRLGSA